MRSEGRAGRALLTATVRKKGTVTPMTIDRSEASRAMAKAIAYKACGKDGEAANWARELVRILECAEILR